MTSIEWTHKTINPIHLVKEDGSHGGHWCKKISQGCANCYAEEMNNSNYFKFASHLSYTGNPPDNLIYDRQMLIKNTKTKTSSLIFLGSMTDLLGDWIPDEWILDIIAIAKRSLHVFQFLTKRPERMKEVFGKIDPVPNIWLGTSIEDQNAFDSRAEILFDLKVDGWKTFYSCEPLLSSIDLYLDRIKVDWVIVGGESGKKCRKSEEEWFLDIRDQCKLYSIPFFFKQWGDFYPYKEPLLDGRIYHQHPCFKF